MGQSGRSGCFTHYLVALVTDHLVERNDICFFSRITVKFTPDRRQQFMVFHFGTASNMQVAGHVPEFIQIAQFQPIHAFVSRQHGVFIRCLDLCAYHPPSCRCMHDRSRHGFSFKMRGYPDSVLPVTTITSESHK